MASVNKPLSVFIVFYCLFKTLLCNSMPNIIFVLTDDQDVTMGGQVSIYSVIINRLYGRTLHLYPTASREVTYMYKYLLL